MDMATVWDMSTRDTGGMMDIINMGWDTQVTWDAIIIRLKISMRSMGGDILIITIIITTIIIIISGKKRKPLVATTKGFPIYIGCIILYPPVIELSH